MNKICFGGTHIAILFFNPMLAYDEKSMFSLPPVSNHHTLAFVLAPTHISSTMASTFPAMFKRQLTNLKLEEFKSKH